MLARSSPRPGRRSSPETTRSRKSVGGTLIPSLVVTRSCEVENFEVPARLLPADPAAQLREVELRQVLAETRQNVRQPHVGDGVHELVAAEREPGAQRAGAAREMDGEREPRAPRRDVHVVELQEQLAVPVVERLERFARDIAAQVERRRQVAGRRRAHPEPVPPAPIEQLKGDVFQLQLRRLALLVVPDDGGIVDLDVALAQQPFGEAAPAFAGRHLDAADRYGPALIAPDVERGAVDIQRVEAQLARQHRHPRQGIVDARELERRPARRVVDRHLLQHELRAKLSDEPAQQYACS